MSNFHAVQFDGTTFGMTIDKKSESYKQFKKHFIPRGNAIGIFGDELKNISQIHWQYASAIMQEAGWLIKEGYISKFTIEGFNEGYEIYVNYTPNEILDFRKRKKENL